MGKQEAKIMTQALEKAASKTPDAKQQEQVRATVEQFQKENAKIGEPSETESLLRVPITIAVPKGTPEQSYYGGEGGELLHGTFLLVVSGGLSGPGMGGDFSVRRESGAGA